MKPLEERKAALEAEIVRQQKKGWQVISKTETSCQFTIKKNIDIILVIVLFIFFVLPAILYLILRKKSHYSIC